LRKRLIMTKKQRLELTWIGKEIRPKLEPRILLEDPDKSYHAAHRVSENDIFDNRLIFGDNLLALKALESEFAGKVKCVFIDPPYNTGSAFEHYDDGVEHSIWLGLMRDRLEILRNLLSNDGSIWITIDDNEAHYLKVMCDEIFGRANFVANVIWQKKFSPQNDDKGITATHDHILVFGKDKSKLKINLLPRSLDSEGRYSNPDNDTRGVWSSGDLTSKTKAKNHSYPITSPTGKVFHPPEGRQWAPSLDTFNKWVEDNRIWFGADGNNKPRIKQFLSEVQQGIVPLSIWLRDDVSDNQAAKREVNAFNFDSLFETPKPELLLKRVIELASNPHDLVLDSFAGSGTTGAVAHKMGRRWIMIELGEHCHTHIIPRLKKVIDGEDQGGISKAVNWKGGGGFRYYQLAPSLLEKDKWDNWIINKTYNAEMLAEALCKIEGFTYSPSDTFYWQHGYSTERDFIYVTTQNLRHEQLSKLADEVGQERSLLVLCTAFRGKTDIFPNLTVKKIPKQILSRCEWGHDDYSLKIENLPKAPQKIGQLTLFDLDNIQ
jgi:adenine-specific DNA-methyltransferase